MSIRLSYNFFVYELYDYRDRGSIGTAVRTGELTGRQGETVDGRRRGIVGQERITDQAPKPFFDRPQIGGLSHKGDAIHLCRKVYPHNYETLVFCVIGAFEVNLNKKLVCLEQLL